MKIEWTTDPPTKAGYYWLRELSSGFTEVMLVDIDCMGVLSWWEYKEEDSLNIRWEWNPMRIARSVEPLEKPE